tara:strand:+ start:498 stop:770 length:273 start_codon:yes stop_codon:yes gene_type:complete
MAGENSRNNRIRMEDPFTREPENTKVFTHIRDIEVAKYIMGSSYLEKDELDDFTVIGIPKQLGTFRLFMQELVLDFRGRYSEACSDLCRE